MKWKNFTFSILIGLFLANAVLLTASAQYVQPGDQIMVNQPYDVAASNITPPASFAQQQYPYADTNAPYAAPLGAPMAAPYGAYGAPMAAPCAAPLATPCAVPFEAPVAPCGPYTSGFTYSATESSAFGPFTPPVSQATEQFYQYPGLTPYGAYPGAGYSAVGGVGFDPMSGYYGPYGAYAPLI